MRPTRAPLKLVLSAAVLLIALPGAARAHLATGRDVPLPPVRPRDLPALRQVPLPPVRPHDLVPPAAPPPVAASPVDNDALRAKVLASGEIVGQSLPPITGSGGCGIAAPVRLDDIVLAGGTKVKLAPPVTLRASLASAIANWVRDDLAPKLAASGQRLIEIKGTGGYECRTRDSIVGAKLSEHAKGNALDLHAFVMKRGETLTVADSVHRETPAARSFWTLAKATACERFMTVLGPGADSYHALHLHIDLEARHSGMHLCEWDLPQGKSKIGVAEKH